MINLTELKAVLDPTLEAGRSAELLASRLAYGSGYAVGSVTATQYGREIVWHCIRYTDKKGRTQYDYAKRYTTGEPIYLSTGTAHVMPKDWEAMESGQAAVDWLTKQISNKGE